MATLGVLAAMMPQFPQQLPVYDPLQAYRLAGAEQGLQRNETLNRTALLDLAELQRQQRSAENVRQAYRADPSLLLGGGMPTIGSLQDTPQPPGPLTQGPLPGMPGATETIPAYPDASRYAGVSPAGGGPLPAGVGMPTVTPTPPPLGGRSAQPGPATAQERLVALARTDPEAAMTIMEQQQKRQTQALDWRSKIAGYVGSVLQGVNSQESYDAVRDELARNPVTAEMAARLPATYSKEALQPFIDRALSVRDAATNRLEAAKLTVLLRGQDVDMLKMQQQGGKLHYQTDAQGNIVAVPEYAHGTTLQARPVLGADGQPIKSLEGTKLTQQQQQQVLAREDTLRNQLQQRMQPFYEVRDAIGRIETAAQAPDPAGDLSLVYAYVKMLDPNTGVRDSETRASASAGGLPGQVGYWIEWLKGNQVLPDQVRKDFLERARMLYTQYGKDYGAIEQQYRELTASLGGNPNHVVIPMGSTAAKPPTAAVTKAQLQEWATQRSKDLGRAVTVDEVRKDVESKGYKVER